MRAIFAHILSFVLVLSGFALSDAKGASHDVGMEIVICSGVGMTTITIGPDGEPIETKEVCPDGDSVFNAPLALPDMPRLLTRVQAFVPPVSVAHAASRDELTPSARGPPALV